jgi:uracil-DNA glycosylase
MTPSIFGLEQLQQWHPDLAAEMDKPYFQDLQAFLANERRTQQIFPPDPEVFTAFALTPLQNLKVLILGQDPYHDDGQAHGLSFSVKPDVKIPPSLKNMYKELNTDLGIEPPNHGYLTPWAKQGVMLLNAVLTVQAHEPNSHKNQGWEKFTDQVIRLVSLHCNHTVFVLWGGYAKKKAKLIDKHKHTILQSAHPSPLSARNGFFGSKPYSKINAALGDHGQTEIDWQL